MNPAQLMMIAAYAQAQQLANEWTWNGGTGCYEWKRGGIEFELEMGDEGFILSWLPAGDDIKPVPVQSVKHLLQLTATLAGHD